MLWGRHSGADARRQPAIESIRVGDQVLAQDPQSGALSFRPIVAIHHNPPDATLRIRLGEESIVATGIHRFWKSGRGWTMARDLKPGDTLRMLGGTAQVALVESDVVQPVFNLEVGGGDSFFVGGGARWCTTTVSYNRSPNRSMPSRY